MGKKRKRERYIMEFEAEPAGPNWPKHWRDPKYRLRRLLKWMLRRYGFEMKDCRELTEDE